MPDHSHRAIREARAGQSLIETCIVLALTCVLFFGIFQISQLMAAQEVLHYAARCGLRAETVGFNRFMVDKTVRVAAIPNAGRMTTPVHTGGPAAQGALERSRVPLYLEAEGAGQLPAILDYADWPTVEPDAPTELFDGTLHLEVSQEFPLSLPLHRAFYAGDSVKMTGESYLDSHAALYLDDEGW